MPSAALLLWGGTVRFLFFAGEGHHHLAVGYDADAFIFPVEVVLLPMKNFTGSARAKKGGCVIAAWCLGHAAEKEKTYSFLSSARSVLCSCSATALVLTWVLLPLWAEPEFICLKDFLPPLPTKLICPFHFLELVFASSICELSLGATVQLLVLAHERKESVAKAGNKKLLRGLGMHF